MNQHTPPAPKERVNNDGTTAVVKRRWTAEEDATILRYAGKLKDREIAEMVNRTRAAIRERRQSLLGTFWTPVSWSPTEVNILREQYTRIAPVELRKLLAGRTDKSIHHMTKKLGLRRHKPRISSGQVWTEQEDATMRHLYPDNAAAQLVPHLPGRNQKAIERRAWVLDLTHSEKFWTHHYSTKISLGCYPPELQEVIRLGRKLKKAINDHESQHP